MSFRAVIPRIQRQAGKICRQFSNSVVARSHHCSSRAVPVWRRRYPLEHFLDRSPFSWTSKLIDRQFREMEKLVDEMSPSRWWVREPFYAKTMGKEVEVKYNDKIFEVKIDVSQFSAEELQVSTSGDTLTVSARHEQKPEDHSIVSREFTRQFVVPENVETESLESLVDGDGYIVIKGKVKGSEEAKKRIIEIKRDTPSDTKDTSNN